MLHIVPSWGVGIQENKVILVVEDDPAIGALLIQFFREATPHYAFLVTDVPQALAIVRSLVPDLVLLDYRLPNMNGLELYSCLQARKELRHVPVLFMSAVYPSVLREQQLHFIKKPFGLEDLLLAMATIWANDRDRRD